MSKTTDIVLFLGILDEESIEKFNSELSVILGVTQTSRTWMLFQPLDTDVLCGPKVFTSKVFATTWNHSDEFVSPLVQLFKRFQWQEPENVVLIIEREEGDTTVASLSPVVTGDSRTLSDEQIQQLRKQVSDESGEWHFDTLAFARKIEKAVLEKVELDTEAMRLRLAEMAAEVERLSAPGGTK